VFAGVVETSAPPGTRGFDGYGRALVVRRADGVRAMYAHLERALVDVGDHVSEGQQLATVGTSRGTVAEPHLQFRDSRAHLHFETSRRAYPLPRERDRIDPLSVSPLGEAMPETKPPRVEYDLDDVARWDALNTLIGQLLLRIPPKLRVGEPQNLWDEWSAEFRQAKSMGGDMRRQRLTQWIARYNDARARVYQAGGRGLPPRARDRSYLEEAGDALRDNVIRPITEAAVSTTTLVMLAGLAWLYFESQKHKADPVVVQVGK
jgi:hypothetical protein